MDYISGVAHNVSLGKNNRQVNCINPIINLDEDLLDTQPVSQNTNFNAQMSTASIRGNKRKAERVDISSPRKKYLECEKYNFCIIIYKKEFVHKLNNGNKCRFCALVYVSACPCFRCPCYICPYLRMSPYLHVHVVIVHLTPGPQIILWENFPLSPHFVDQQIREVNRWRTNTDEKDRIYLFSQRNLSILFPKSRMP